MRGISAIFATVFVVEIFVFGSMFIWVYSITVNDQVSRVNIFSRLLAAFGSTLLTSGLVYHNLWQRPELRIMGTIIDPLNTRGRNIATAGYRSHNQTFPKSKHGFLEVKSTYRFSKIRVSTDVCNVGIHQTSIYEYIIKLIKPDERLVGIYPKEENMPHQKRVTLSFDYPEGRSPLRKSSLYEFEMTVKASTQRKSRRIRVIVSEDFKTIKWQQCDC